MITENLDLHAQRLDQQLRDEILLREHFEKVADSKSTFLANMSHEIRTPLGLILGFAEELINSSELTASNRHLIQTIQSNSEILARLISDILDFSKVDAGKLDFNLSRLKTDFFLGQLNTMFSEGCAEKNLFFQIEIVTKLPATFGSDEVRLKQILMNLVGNSLKHTHEGHILLKVSYEPSAGLLIFDVHDTGEGIPEELQPHIFEMFKQVHKDKPGSGLGLPLALNLARGLQGDLTLVRSRPQTGSWFRVKIKDQIQNLEEFSASAPIDEVPQDLPYPDLSSWKILVVDDIEDNIKLLDCILRPTKAQMDSTTCPQKAITMARDHKYDLVLLDLIMPQVGGFQVLELLRRQGCQAPIWAVSARAMKNEKKNCLNAGFSEHVSKPIQRKSFYKKLSQLQYQIKELSEYF